VSEITIVQDFAAPIERVFAALADQERMGSWMGAKISVAQRGPSGLVGTVRRIHIGPATLDERIEEVEAPHFIAYRIVSPLPLLRHHRGEQRLEALSPDRARLRWRIVMELRPAFLSPLLLSSIKFTVERALGRLAHSLTV
jgi:uncharacterized protein YndB with AHSA1/START domain